LAPKILVTDLTGLVSQSKDTGALRLS